MDAKRKAKKMKVYTYTKKIYFCYSRHVFKGGENDLHNVIHNDFKWKKEVVILKMHWYLLAMGSKPCFGRTQVRTLIPVWNQSNSANLIQACC